MPFTLAHAAAALPLRRTRLIPSALVVGTFAPDFEYFLRFAPGGRFGHTLLGSFVLTLPLGLLILWLFHRFVKIPLISMLPDSIQPRLAVHLGKFSFSGFGRIVLIVTSILVGVATHILWDSFTHPTSWLYYHWSVLSRTVQLPMVGTVHYFKLFQHSSTIIGMGLLLAWTIRWYRITEDNSRQYSHTYPSNRKGLMIVVIPAVAIVSGVIRAITGIGVPYSPVSLAKFAGEAVVTTVALAWWQLVLWGLLFRNADT